jgi:lipopolysaccharide biosynthesis glycosyltransferase
MNCISLSCSIKKIDSFFKYVLAFVQSLKDNSQLDCKIVIWELGFTEKHKKQLHHIWNNIEFKKIDTDKYYKVNKTNTNWFCLEAFSLYNYNKVLSLDCDMICLGSLKSLFDKQCDLGMVKESTGQYNGGLVLIGQKYLNKKEYNKLLNSDHKNIKLGGTRDKWATDQKIYNYFYKNEITSLPKIYNTLVSEKNALDSHLLHYIYKPLYDKGCAQLDKINPEYNKIWNKYYKKAANNVAGI